jgi:O-methyltransferase involved in polyketide biosynthesis
LRKRYKPIELKFGSDFGEFFAGVLRSAMIVRFAEEVMEEALGKGIDQYVILGAGLDSFALRRRNLAPLPHVEATLPAL